MEKLLATFRELYLWKMAAQRCSIAMAGTDISSAEAFTRSQVNEWCRLQDKVEELEKKLAEKEDDNVQLLGTIEQLQARLENK